MIEEFLKPYIEKALDPHLDGVNRTLRRIESEHLQYLQEQTARLANEFNEQYARIRREFVERLDLVQGSLTSEHKNENAIELKRIADVLEKSWEQVLREEKWHKNE